MNLGNLSSLNKIPDYLVKFLLNYIINISSAFAHAHSNNLVHGNFNPTKVVGQKVSGSENLNFVLTNFEPWNVECLLKKMQ
mgnify:CR=1 FL=1